MPSLMKLTTILQSPGHGWSESLYFNYVNNDLRSAFLDLAVPTARRVNLLGPGAFLKARRVSLVLDSLGAPAKNKVYLDKTIIKPNLQQVDNNLAAPGVCAMPRIYNADQSRHKVIYLRGIPDAIENNDGTYNPLGADGWQNRLTFYFDGLKGSFGGVSNMGWWGYVPFPAIPITSYSVGSTTEVVTVQLPAGSLAAYSQGQKLNVRFRGVNSAKSVLNGQQVVTVIDGGTCKLTKPLAAGPYVTGGEMILYTRTLVPMSILQMDTISHRKIGTPLLVSPGRLPAKART